MTDHNDSSNTEEPFWKQKGLSLPPTEIGETFTLDDIGTDDGGTAVSAVRAAFADCWGEKCLELENEYGNTVVYTFQGTSPMRLDHVPDDEYDPEIHGALQTMGTRYNYDFIRCLGATEDIRVVAWEDTLFATVEEDEVWYP